MSKKFPSYSHKLPSPDQLDIQKLANGGCIMTKTCNQAQKVRSDLSNLVPGSIDFDSMNHLWNVWSGNTEKALTKELNILLQSGLDEIDPQLRVTSSMSTIIHIVNKEFSFSANYSKGHGKLFLEWIKEYHPGVLLLHLQCAAGSRQDLCMEGLMPIYMNYLFYMEFLDIQLCKYPWSNENTSILQQNLFVALTSLEMIALSRLLSTMHVSVCMPFHWLAGKTHELKDCDWGPISMSRVADTLYDKMKLICERPDLISLKMMTL
jgi:hypothetical protein